MNSAVGPLIGSFAARTRRMTPAPASNRNAREPTTIAVAGPAASGSGTGLPVPSKMTTVESALGTIAVADRVVAAESTAEVTASASQRDDVFPLQSSVLFGM